MKCAHPMPESAYRKICEKECQWCAKGSLRNEFHWSHCTGTRVVNNGHRIENVFQPCTASTRDEVIDQLTSALERAEKVARRGKHGADCPHYLPSGWRWETRKRDREPCNCMKRDILAALDSKE